MGKNMQNMPKSWKQKGLPSWHVGTGIHQRLKKNKQTNIC